MQENIYKVPKSQWKKWSEEARECFNYMYNYISSDQDLFLHPKAARQYDKYWETTAWNAAWIAADFVNEKCTENN